MNIRQNISSRYDILPKQMDCVFSILCAGQQNIPRIRL